MIAIARVALDQPRDVAKYKELLKALALDSKMPHILMRHFAAQALLACARGGGIVLSDHEIETLKMVSMSPFETKKVQNHESNSFYQPRPDSVPRPKSELIFDYDFDKNNISRLAQMFGRFHWEVRDSISSWIRKFDKGITSMHETGGRDTYQRDRFGYMTDHHHLYGQQLGWNSLYLTAGEYLAKHPVVQSPYDDDDPWLEWLNQEALTRTDGLWLADGVDLPPVDTQVNLCLTGEKGPALTGHKKDILSLLRVESSIEKELVVAGNWRSVDGIDIRIASALAPTRFAKKLAIQLSEEDPFGVWLPDFEKDSSGVEYSHSEKKPYEGWIVWPRITAALDENDLLGIAASVQRPHFTRAINEIGTLKPQDPFKRVWVNSYGQMAARSEAWRQHETNRERNSAGGLRMICNSEFLTKVLQEKKADLLLLIVLQRYDQRYNSQPSQYWHTTAIVRVTKSLGLTYFPGKVNEFHQMKY